MRQLLKWLHSDINMQNNYEKWSNLLLRTSLAELEFIAGILIEDRPPFYSL